MGFKELLAYKKSFDLAMCIFEVTKSFPKDESYSLTNQIRRSSRSVVVNIAEAYRKRLYRKHFISKLTDSDSENAETQVWLTFACACNYVDKNTLNMLMGKSLEVGKLIHHMIQNPEKFGTGN